MLLGSKSEFEFEMVQAHIPLQNASMVASSQNLYVGHEIWPFSQMQTSLHVCSVTGMPPKHDMPWVLAWHMRLLLWVLMVCSCLRSVNDDSVVDDHVRVNTMLWPR